MKKKTVLIILICIAAGVLLSYIVPGDGTDKTPKMDANTRTMVKCAESDAQLANRWAEVSLLIQQGISKDVNVTALTKKAVMAGRDGIRATRHWIQQCGAVIPDAADQYRQLIKEIHPKLDQLEGK